MAATKDGKGQAFVDRPETLEEFMLAGIGVFERGSSNRPRKFRKALKRGRKAQRSSDTYAGALARVNAVSPVYVLPGGGGGWHEIWLREILVGRVQGEDEALRRMAELTLEYIDVDEGERAAPADMRAGGGGWYELTVHGVVVDRVQGEQEARARVDQFRGTTMIDS
jgi:hypothetical protein